MEFRELFINLFSEPVCAKNEEYIICGPICPATCSPRDPTLNCKSRECIKGCFCKAGFSRTPNGDCVKHGECPRVAGSSSTTTTTAKPK